MLNRFDDYPIHQTTDPIAHVVSGDRNHYDRYFFHGYPKDGSFFFCSGFAIYPNRRIKDAHFSIVHEGKQYSLHVSGLLGKERTETNIGPYSIEVIEPMRSLRLKIEKNEESAVECDLTFRAATIPIEEHPKMTRVHGTRKFMETSRFAQYGSWEGYVAINGKRMEMTYDQSLATRDRSWGVRPVGEGEPGAPGPIPQLFWLWAPLQLGDQAAILIVDEDTQGNSRNNKAEFVPKYKSLEDIPEDEEGVVQGGKVIKHEVTWRPGTRRVQECKLHVEMPGSGAEVVTLTPFMDFQLLSLGYLHPEWGHAFWKGEYAIEGEEWELDKLNPMEFKHLHVEQLCKVDFRGEEHIGVLEQLIIGAYEPYGFKGLLDGYGDES